MGIKRINTIEELEAAFTIRKLVFVEEQQVPLEDEFDEHDTYAEHILVFHNNEPVGTGRLRIVDDYIKLERICILADYRSYGYGKEIIASLESIGREKGFEKAKLHGQTHAEGFYEKLGYKTSSAIFMEDGIPHVLMIKKL